MFAIGFLFAAACATDAAPDSADSGNEPDSPAPCAPTEEVCNGLDDDCDGRVDEDAADMAWTSTDDDGDGYGGRGTWGCPTETEVPSGDCDDANPAVNPDAVELCDGMDNNCREGIDEANSADCVTRYEDNDDDGTGLVKVCACPDARHTADSGGDCDDSDDGFAAACGGALIASLAPVAEITGLGGPVESVGDLDGDGVSDVLAASQLLVNPVVGSTSASDALLATIAETGVPSPLLTDLDGDGLGDVVYTEATDGPCWWEAADEVCWRTVSYRVYLSPLSGTPVSAAEFGPVRGPRGGDYMTRDIAMFLGGDLDADGDDDLLVIDDDPNADVLALYNADGDGTDSATLAEAQSLWTTASSGGYVPPAVLSDLDADGVDDLVWYGMVIPGPLAPLPLPSTGGVWDGAGTVVSMAPDLDGDGIPQLSYFADSYGFELANIPEGWTSTWADLVVGRILPPAGADDWELPVMGDLDGDGADELVFRVAWPDGTTDISVWSGPLIGDHELSEARHTWTFDASLAMYPSVASPRQGALGVSWQEARAQDDAWTLSFLPVW